MRILAVAGASGGHIFPAIGFLDRLVKDDPSVETVLVLPRRSIKRYIPAMPHTVKYVSTTALGFRPCLKNLFAFFKVLMGIAESFFLIAEFRPDAVIGFGSIISVPVVFWAWLFRVRVVLHEQNVVPGLATRVLSYIAETVCVSFRETSARLPSGYARIVVTGNVVRASLVVLPKQEALAYFGFTPGKFTLLVVGGSQSSRRINRCVMDWVCSCGEVSGLQVIHLCGRDDLPEVRRRYDAAGVAYFAADFFSDMQYAYSAADFCISRAGATTISELVRYRLPALLVPYPFAGAHQAENARLLQRVSAAVTVSDAEATPEMVGAGVGHVMSSGRVLAAMKAGYGSLNADADAAGALCGIVREQG